MSITRHTITITLDIDSSKFDDPSDEKINASALRHFKYKLSELQSCGREWEEGVEDTEIKAEMKSLAPTKNVHHDCMSDGFKEYPCFGLCEGCKENPDNPIVKYPENIEDMRKHIQKLMLESFNEGFIEGQVDAQRRISRAFDNPEDRDDPEWIVGYKK